jgi:hypothetical protein
MDSLTPFYALAVILGVFWPIGMPAFIYYYSAEISSVREGRDWADDHIPDEQHREHYRQNEVQLHRQIKREADERRQRLEITRRNR